MLLITASLLKSSGSTVIVVHVPILNTNVAAGVWCGDVEFLLAVKVRGRLVVEFMRIVAIAVDIVRTGHIHGRQVTGEIGALAAIAVAVVQIVVDIDGGRLMCGVAIGVVHW